MNSSSLAQNLRLVDPMVEDSQQLVKLKALSSQRTADWLVSAILSSMADQYTHCIYRCTTYLIKQSGYWHWLIGGITINFWLLTLTSAVYLVKCPIGSHYEILITDTWYHHWSVHIAWISLWLYLVCLIQYWVLYRAT